MILIVMGAMVFEWAIMMPSEIAFTNWQTYEHNNPIRTDLESIKHELEELKKKL